MGGTDIISIISQVGFPIAVATYSLVQLDKSIRKNTEVMTQVVTKLDIVADKEG